MPINSMMRTLIFFGLLASTALGEGYYTPQGGFWRAPSQEEVGYYKARKTISVLQRSLQFTPDSTVYASTCRQTLVLSDFLDRKELTPRKTDGQPVVPPASMGQLPTGMAQLFKVIQGTVLGRAVLKKFMPKYGFDVKVTFEDSTKIRQAARSSTLAYFNPLTREIRVYKSGELGKTAFVLLHEIIHALDSDYRRAVDKQQRLRAQFERELGQLVRSTSTRLGKPKDNLLQVDFPPAELQRLAWMKNVIEEMDMIQIFRAERFAYDASYDVWKELSRIYPAFYRRFPPTYHTDEKIVALNGLDGSVIDRYKKGNCKAFNPDALKPRKLSSKPTRSRLNLLWERRRGEREPRRSTPPRGTTKRK